MITIFIKKNIKSVRHLELMKKFNYLKKKGLYNNNKIWVQKNNKISFEFLHSMKAYKYKILNNCILGIKHKPNIFKIHMVNMEPFDLKFYSIENCT
jgi:hypothetical protein